MNGLDHYALLGVRCDASAHEIRRAYRRLARQHHPDLNPRPGEAEQFAELARAYAVLGDPDQRARYDRTLHGTPAPGRSHPPRPPAPERAFRRGILELSPSEAWHLARHSLMLSDSHGRQIALPAGAGHGDEIILLYDGEPVVLTIRLQKP